MKKLTQLANNQIVIENENGIEFWSYGTFIAKLWKDGEMKGEFGLTNYWDYSRTTTKWLLEFMRKFVGVDTNSKEIRKDLEKGLIKFIS